jgi:histidinol-phosphate aminotransferase
VTELQPGPNVAAVTAYAPSRHPAPCDIDLAGSEGPSDPVFIARALGAVPDAARRYPDASRLAAKLAVRFGIGSEQVLVTAGADDALERACRAILGPDRDAILTSPTFEMLPRYVALAGATAVAVAWPEGAFPVAAVIASATPRTALIAIVSPNNPTGAVLSIDKLRRLHDAVPTALILLDLVYVDFADLDLTNAALELPRVLVVRTFSKAWGLAGLRVGYALGPADVIGWMRAAGSPYPVSGPSLAVATLALSERETAVTIHVTAVRAMRARLTTLLQSFDLAPSPSEANFVCIATPSAAWLRDVLAGFGIAVRLLPGTDVDRVRITCPGDEVAFARVEMALRAALQPQAILFDVDGVLVDVSRSYRIAIRETAARFGVTVSSDDVRTRKAAGNANDDWELTAGLIESAGKQVALDEVITVFERLYQGDGVVPGLRTAETCTTTHQWLAGLARRWALGIVTGRPRIDADRFLRDTGTRDLFGAVIVHEDGPLKPDPFPVRAAMDTLGVTRAWMVGDTPDDIRAARAAGALPIGIVAPGDPADVMTAALLRAGAARVYRTVEEITACLP